MSKNTYGKHAVVLASDNDTSNMCVPCCAVPCQRKPSRAETSRDPPCRAALSVMACRSHAVPQSCRAVRAKHLSCQGSDVRALLPCQFTKISRTNPCQAFPCAFLLNSMQK